MKKLEKKLKKQSKTKNDCVVPVEKKDVPGDLKKIVKDDVKKFLDIIGFNHYKTRVYFPKEDVGENGPCNDGMSEVAASARIDQRYLRIDLYVYPFMVEGYESKYMGIDDIHEIIAHEMSHLATQHLYRIALATFKDQGETIDAWESLTTLIGRLVNRIDNYERGLTNGKQKSSVKE